MTEHERDPEATGPGGAADEPETDGELEEAQELDDTEGLGDEDLEPEEEPEAEPGPEPRATPASAAAGAAAAGPRRRGRDRQPVRAAPAPPTVSEQAVHVQDRASAVFVIGTVGLFVAILAYGLLFGSSGFVTGLLPTPTPAPTASPAVPASPSAGASAGASESPAASGSGAPSASPAASESPSGSVAPSPAASPTSPSPSAS